jgi:peptidyl-dipeptidase A
LARELDLTYYAFLENQMDSTLLKQIVDASAAVEQKFSTFRGRIGGKEVTTNDIDDILKKETDATLRRDAWLAGKSVGDAVAGNIIALVKLRNRAARELGFDNYHTFSLALSEQRVGQIDTLFDTLDKETEAPFLKAKAEIDLRIADSFRIPASEISPWHYQDPYFQEAPMPAGLDLDPYYKNRDILKIATAYYAGLGLPVESIVSNSDLYEKPGKNPHAFSTDIDHEGDERILCNLRNDSRWMETLLHELGHAVYDRYGDPKTPYLLRGPAHAFTTEAVAIYFGRKSFNPDWMQANLGLNAGEKAAIERVAGPYAKVKLLIFARWDMVMYHFEKALYADPDQDLNALWWSLVEKYQHVRKPEGRNKPDWAAKIHFVIAPCYYHNYLLGELLASQFENGTKRPESIGRYFRNVFEAGTKYPWYEMIARTTGEPLNPRYFAQAISDRTAGVFPGPAGRFFIREMPTRTSPLRGDLEQGPEEPD